MSEPADSTSTKKQESPISELAENTASSSSVVVTGLNESKSKNEETGGATKKSHHSGLLQLFSGKSKQQPPNSLENLSVKVVGGKSKSDSTNPPATTPSSSVSFLQRLPFHHHLLSSKGSHAAAESSPSPDSSNHPPLTSAAFASSPVHALSPLPEADTPLAEEPPLLESGNLTPHYQADHISVQSPLKEASEAKKLVGNEGVVQQPLTLSERDAIQNTLDVLLKEFRSGKMRSLSDQQLEQLRDMHCEQLKLSALHMAIYKEDMELNSADSPRKSHNLGQAGFGSDDFDEKYAKIAQQLDHLHDMMDQFHS